MAIPTQNENEILKWVWNNLVPKNGQSSSVQGELLRCNEALRWEAQNNGNINWDDGFNIMAGFLKEKLDDGDQQFLSDIKRITDFKSPDECENMEELGTLGPYIEDDLYDRIEIKILRFCQNNPEIINREINNNLYR